MLYLSGRHSQDLAALAASGQPVGLMAQPRNAAHRHVQHYQWWAADNACYAHPDAFNPDAWLRWLSCIPRRDGCLFAVAPDVLGDADATLDRARPWLPHLRRLGYPAALVAQDGATPQSLPWLEFDCLFLGGSTQWKLSAAAGHVAAEARAHGKHVHMGRVNSLRRLQAAQLMGCHSVDGTFLAYRARVHGHPYDTDRGPQELGRWLAVLDASPFLGLTYGGTHG